MNPREFFHRHGSLQRQLLLGGLALALALAAGGASTPSTGMPTVRANGTIDLYLPLVFKPYSEPTVFGAEMARIRDADGLEKMADADTSWVRRASVDWRKVEATEGVFDWTALASIELDLVNASTHDMRVVLVVRAAPDWALVNPSKVCGRVTNAKMEALGDFVHELVLRYSAFPYNVHYWEFWNEPDIDPDYVQSDSYIGCWGDETDPYYGGGYYAEMLAEVYPEVKSADPTSQVLVGGLLLDCDPRTPGLCPNGNDTPPKFLEGILQNGGGPNFDGVSFHAYDYYFGALGHYGNSNWASAWNTTGPVATAKAGFIQSMLTDYSVTGKFLMNTESALLCGGPYAVPGQPPCQSAYETTKAYYVAQAYGSAIALDLVANIWFTPLGWRNSGLLNADLTEREAYTAYEFARSELRDAAYASPVTSGDLGGASGVKGYKYDRGDRTVWLLWSLDGADHAVTFSGTPLAVYDVFGVSSVPSTAQTVGLKPLYIEWP